MNNRLFAILSYMYSFYVYVLMSSTYEIKFLDKSMIYDRSILHINHLQVMLQVFCFQHMANCSCVLCDNSVMLSSIF